MQRRPDLFPVLRVLAWNGAAAWPMEERIEAVPLAGLFAALRNEREHA